MSLLSRADRAFDAADAMIEAGVPVAFDDLFDACLPTDLETEMGQLACAMTWPAVEMLLALGAERRFVARLTGQGDLAVAGVDLSRDGSVWSAGGPTRRLLLAVRDEWGEVIDIAALSSSARDEWALRTGDGWALGRDMLAEAAQARDEASDRAVPGKAVRPVRLRLFATPLDWLAGGGAGICVLDWGLMALTSLRSLGEAVTLLVDAGAQDRLRGLLAHGGLPRVESAAGRSGLGLAA